MNCKKCKLEKEEEEFTKRFKYETLSNGNVKRYDFHRNTCKQCYNLGRRNQRQVKEYNTALEENENNKKFRCNFCLKKGFMIDIRKIAGYTSCASCLDKIHLGIGNMVRLGNKWEGLSKNSVETHRLQLK